MRTLVLDTNIVLDVFVFDDAAAKPLAAALEEGEIEWVATQSMRDELERVLAYPHLATRLAFYGLDAAGVLSRFDRHARIVDVAAKAGVTCSDPDDQKFIDLAVANRCALLSKDAAVLTMRKRMAALGCHVGKTEALSEPAR
ncbi:putative toxin-antitoxin system toxin component, PIN family [Caenimonas aquaedulcis]|uniref:Toxin-antitoxin system toxin component, PIN family n=1 Tax=Caenimonas aquaedulcis TaxID=2793270 RepID=A0A931MIH6_9BURK|nr:putative toxin-antitoxin system toxin component, PIN family [Caenimonas aquaedulcis]MBG9389270.1 putative toxin-antitoxin system toxin component, PIN family [Caenimonas aquaedulcis]